MLVKDQGVSGIRSMFNKLFDNKSLVLENVLVDNWREKYQEVISDVSSIEVMVATDNERDYIAPLGTFGLEVDEYIVVEHVKYKVKKVKPKSFINTIINDSNLKNFERFRIIGPDTITKNNKAIDLLENNVIKKINRELLAGTFVIDNKENIFKIMKSIIDEIN